MCLAQGHSSITVLLWLGIEPWTPGFKSPTLTTRPWRIHKHLNQYIYYPLSHTVPLWCLCSQWLFKTLWQKEKFLIISNFSFNHNVFNSFQSFYFHSQRFLYFCRDAFKVVCCRFGVSGKVINAGLITTHFQENCKNVTHWVIQVKKTDPSKL